MTNALAFEDFGEELGFFDGGGAYEDRLLEVVEAGDLVGDGEVLLLGGAEDDVLVLDAEHLAIGGDDGDVELVDLVELGGLGFGGAGHTRHVQLLLEVWAVRGGTGLDHTHAFPVDGEGHAVVGLVLGVVDLPEDHVVPRDEPMFSVYCSVGFLATFVVADLVAVDSPNQHR